MKRAKAAYAYQKDREVFKSAVSSQAFLQHALLNGGTLKMLPEVLKAVEALATPLIDAAPVEAARGIDER